MTPERLAKIRALAADYRGNPHVRAMAQRILDAQPKPRWTPPPDPPAPGIKTSEEHRKRIFFDLNQWGESANGNYVHTMEYRDREYRFVIFRQKRTIVHGWGWLRVDVKNDTKTWGRNKYETVREALDSAWLHLSLI